MPTKNKTDVKALLALSDEEVMQAALSDPDAQPTDADFWANAEIVMPKKKEQVTLKLDANVVKYFKSGGRGYNTRINAVLKSYVESHLAQA